MNLKNSFFSSVSVLKFETVMLIYTISCKITDLMYSVVIYFQSAEWIQYKAV